MAYFEPSLSDQSFAGTAARLLHELSVAEPLLRAISDSQASKPRAPGKWSRKQILGHLIDSAANNHQRFVRGQAAPALHLPGYAQEHWVASQRYDECGWEDLIGLWCAYNRHLVHVIAQIPEDKRNVPCEIGENPPVTLGHIACDYVGHLQHHLAQIFQRQ